jgi:hypothetical protein
VRIFRQLRCRKNSLPMQTIVLGMILLAFSGITFAQHGGGGGHIGGTTAGGGGLSGSNGTNGGVDQKDDLKGFHDVIAVQATREQAAAYAAMLKSTEAADVELKAIEEQAANATAVAEHANAFDDALEGALILNKKFIAGFSEHQKNGLKEVTKRLGKADAELAKQGKAIDLALATNLGAAQTSGLAQNLEHSLANFQRAQADLGDEMSIQAATVRQNFVFHLLPARHSTNIGNQSIAINSSGVVSKAASNGGQNGFSVALTEDLSDLQQSMTELLRAELDKSERCGERVAVRTAELSGNGPAAIVRVQFHFEHWTCPMLYGKENMNEIAESEATLEVQLTPSVTEDGALKMTGQVSRVEGGGLVGDLLRTGALGESMRDKISDLVLSVLREAGDFREALPTATRNYAVLRRMQFQGMGSGKLIAVLNGEIKVPNEQMASLTSELEQASQERTVPGPLLTRPAAAQESVSR